MAGTAGKYDVKETRSYKCGADLALMAYGIRSLAVKVHKNTLWWQMLKVQTPQLTEMSLGRKLCKLGVVFGLVNYTSVFHGKWSFSSMHWDSANRLRKKNNKIPKLRFSSTIFCDRICWSWQARFLQSTWETSLLRFINIPSPTDRFGRNKFISWVNLRSRRQ